MKITARALRSLIESEIGTHAGLKVYGPRPGEAAMQNRLKKDFPQARKALELVTGFGRKGKYEYYVEVWAEPTGSGAFITYSRRRDGRIGASWSPVSAEKVVLL